MNQASISRLKTAVSDRGEDFQWEKPRPTLINAVIEAANERHNGLIASCFYVNVGRGECRCVSLIVSWGWIGAVGTVSSAPPPSCPSFFRLLGLATARWHWWRRRPPPVLFFRLLGLATARWHWWRRRRPSPLLMLPICQSNQLLWLQLENGGNAH